MYAQLQREEILPIGILEDDVYHGIDAEMVCTEITAKFA
jgi:hypothetical protein